MFESKEIAFVIGCIDCRHHEHTAGLIPQLKEILGVREVYLYTLAGPDGQVLKQGAAFESAVADATLIKNAKGASVFAVLPHYGCAGHNVSSEQHDIDGPKAAQLLSETTADNWIPLMFFETPGSAYTWGVKRSVSTEPVVTAA